MWRKVGEGVVFTGPKEAYASLRDRARRAIAQGDFHGFEVRHVKIRLKDEAGVVFFDGTIGDAARLEIDGEVYLPPAGT